MARYLRSTTTGVVLPYNERLLMRPNVEQLTDEEVTAYEASLKPKAAVAAEPPPPPPPPPPEPEPEPEAAVLDVSDEEVDADALLASLEVD